MENSDFHTSGTLTYSTPFPLGSENESCVSVCSVVSDSVALWTVAHQVPLPMESSRQEYWSELPFPTPGDLPNPGIKCMSPALEGRFFTTSATWKTQNESYYM